jgi:hypothetical protein
LAEHEAARTIKGLSSIIRDLEDQVGKLEGDAATAATATKDAMETMEKKIAKLDGELIEAKATHRSDLDDAESEATAVYTAEVLSWERYVTQKPHAKARSGDLDRRKSRTYIRVSSENMCNELMSLRNECVNWSQIELEQPRCNSGSQEQQTRKRRCDS